MKKFCSSFICSQWWYACLLHSVPEIFYEVTGNHEYVRIGVGCSSFSIYRSSLMYKRAHPKYVFTTHVLEWPACADNIHTYPRNVTTSIFVSSLHWFLLTVRECVNLIVSHIVAPYDHRALNCMWVDRWFFFKE